MGDSQGDYQPPEGLHVVTPLIESYAMSKRAGFTVHLKLDNAQPSATFKIRGVGYQIQKEKSKGCKRIVCSSGGNAGLAAAYACRKLQLPLTLYVPSTTPKFMVERLRGEGAEVSVAGCVWDEANAKALQTAAENSDYTYIHPFDHPDVWEGHTSMMIETKEQLKGIKPDLVILSVGGGGLMVGVLEGMAKVGWADVPLLAMETLGADCFNAAIKAGHLVTLPGITSIAKCLGALTVCKRAMELYHERPIHSEVITDKQCVQAMVNFLDDHRILVEPACGAALGAVYSDVIKCLQDEGKLGDIKNAVMVVCGGAMVDIETLAAWRKEFDV